MNAKPQVAAAHNTRGQHFRPCVLCGEDDSEPVFAYTYDFLVGVRGMVPARLARRGWTPETTSTIVRCRKCGCKYVRDPFLSPDDMSTGDYEDVSQQIVVAQKQRQDFDHYVTYSYNDEKYWIARTLVSQAARRRKGDVSFLDFGAGGGTTCNIVRSLGVGRVVAYDPFYSPDVQSVFDKVNFPGIECVRSRSELLAKGPFDAISFQAAVEHVFDPRDELATIFALLRPGGFFYVNNPVMDLEAELPVLKAAKRIVKSDLISHYHPSHLNYMMPAEFERLLRSIGFRLTPWVPYAPVPMLPGNLRPWLKRNAKVVIRTTQNALRLPYRRYSYLVEKPRG